MFRGSPWGHGVTIVAQLGSLKQMSCLLHINAFVVTMKGRTMKSMDPPLPVNGQKAETRAYGNPPQIIPTIQTLPPSVRIKTAATSLSLITHLS